MLSALPRRDHVCALLLSGASLAMAADAPALAYTVQPGDTLIGIRDRLLAPGSHWQAIQSADQVINPRRLMPGRVLLLPTALLREQPLQAEVLHTHGDVRLERPGAPVQRLVGGERLASGDVLHTGAQSSAVLRLADGSRLLLRQDSRLRLERLAELRHGSGGSTVDTRIHLGSGSADTTVKPTSRPQFQIRTPVANLGVRGTDFRATTSATQTTLEVLQGRVAASALAAPGLVPQDTAAGHGTLVNAQGVAAPRQLPAPPQLSGLPERIERLPLRLAWQVAAEPSGVPALPIASYRAQVVEADPPGRLLLEGVFGAEGARWADELPDGRYRLLVRSRSADGLEGRDSSAMFTLKARPEPPFLTSPRAGARSADDNLLFAWTQQAAAARYRLQVADTADFQTPRVDRDDLTGAELRLPLPVGSHHWRMASIRADGDTGPWSDPLVATRVALPPAPAQTPPLASADGVLLSWRAEPGQRHQLQVATDAGFSQLLHDTQLDSAEWLLRSPPPGRYFVRVRSIDADGFVGPYGAVQQVDVPQRPMWWLLVPAVLLLLL